MKNDKVKNRIQEFVKENNSTAKTKQEIHEKGNNFSMVELAKNALRKGTTIEEVRHASNIEKQTLEQANEEKGVDLNGE